jgi:aminoglycoside phosphotransferase (APT) family kinase protein
MSVWSSGVFRPDRPSEEVTLPELTALFRSTPVSELTRLERLLPDAVAGTGMLHGDLRIDNVLIDRSGKAWLCDWTWPCLGAPWFELVTLLVTAYASGAEADRFLADAPAEGVDAALAGLSGYWLSRAAGPSGSASPHSRQHHAYSGRAALAWLSARRGRHAA